LQRALAIYEKVQLLDHLELAQILTEIGLEPAASHGASSPSG
jgi:hypothetical protein